MLTLAACSSKDDTVGSVGVTQETEQFQRANHQRAPGSWVTSGSKKLDVAAQRRYQAMGYFSQGDLEKAEPLLIESLKLYKDALEEGRTNLKNQISREYMEAHRYLYILYSETDRHNEAEQSLNKGIIALAENFNASDQTINAFIKSIEKFNKDQANRQYIEQQVASQNRNHPEEGSPYILASKNRVLGNKHFFKQEYDKAEHYFQLVLDYCETSSDQAPDLCCKAMNDMGALKSGIVQSDDGLSYFESALSLAEKHFSPDHIIIADTLVNIGHYYSSVADYKKALPPYKRSLRIFEKSYGPNHPSVLQIHFALGRLYLFEDDIDNASQYTKKAMTGIERTLGTDNGVYARCLFNMGFIHQRNKEYIQAEKYYIRALGIWKNETGPTFQPQSITHTLLARLYAERKDYELAVYNLIECHQIVDKSVDQITDFTSENQQLYRAEEDTYTLKKYLDLIGKHYTEDQLKIKEAFNIWLKGKGRILDVQARLYDYHLAGDNQEIARLMTDLNKVRAELSRLTFSQPGNLDKGLYKRNAEELEKKKDRLEAQLSRISKSFSATRKIATADSGQISKMLPNGSVLLEFARTQAILENSEGGVDTSYIAFILHASEGGDVGLVNLGDANQIDDLITEYKKALSASGKEDGRAAIATSRQLYNLVFHPLVKYLGTSKHIFISPDGNLSLIPFEVFQKPNGSFLIDEYTINYLSASRDLVGFDNERRADGKCLLMGGPDFNMASSNSSFSGKAATTRDSDLGKLSFGPLPAAKEELEAISKVMGGDQTELYIGQDALEETLLNADHPTIIHLATHGFFLSGDQLPGDGRGFKMAELSTTGKKPRPQIKLDIKNPLLRSGIQLAGAKSSFVNGAIGSYDGFATAEEILGMNLHGTEMVVLSACDTGLGEVKSGEGVFGLRRAFTQAGAKSLVMSMWKVPDKETKELMVQFYKNIKSGTMNRCQALRQAILKEKEIVKQRYGYDNPRYWGAFVFMGQS
jgi:CHAT domain-containing protein